MRLFVALSVPETLIDILAPTMEAGPRMLRWIPEDDLHCTLRFIGEVERSEANDIADALAEIEAPRLSVTLDGVGIFDHRLHGALWARLAPKPPIEALHNKIDRALVSLGFEPDRRAYIPHITLARWSGGRLDARTWAERWAGLSSTPVEIDSVDLVQSQLSHAGPHYTSLATFPLQA